MSFEVDISKRDEYLEMLSDKNLPIESVSAIYNVYIEDKEVVSQIAMNLSLRTSVYDRELQSSTIIKELLDKIALNGEMDARWAVAKNPHTSSETLKKLSKDNINLVRALVATNSNTPIDTLKKLFNDEKIVRDGLSGNINTPLDILEVLSKDSDKMVRLRVSENDSVSNDILLEFLKDSDQNVVKSAKVHLDKRGVEYES
jgi:hypothetical protein